MILTMSITLHADAEPSESRSERIRWAFSELNVDTMDLLDDFYHKDIHFVDPVVNVTGLDDLRAHYEHQYGAVTEIDFTFTDEFIAGDTHTVEWEMTLATKRLNKGEPFTVPGASVLTFEGNKVIYHRDYFDLGNMLYERLPVVRSITKRIKKRLSFQSKKEKKK
jgi:limonene-1,2-epoxide hydrolase